MSILSAIKTIGVRRTLPEQTLKTPWTDTVTADNVWQEYPRPQMRRDSWQNLNGLWSYAIRGGEEAPSEWDGQILVPFSPEAPLSGVNRQLLPGKVLWYERRFEIGSPQAAEGCGGGHYLLHFGAVDERCKVWINGSLAGNHAGGYLPFTLDITDRVKAGENTLTLACRDDSNTSWHTRGKQKLRRGGMFYTAQSGIWQTVWLEHVPEVYIASLEIRPRYDEKTVDVQIHLEGDLTGNPAGKPSGNPAGKPSGNPADEPSGIPSGDLSGGAVRCKAVVTDADGMPVAQQSAEAVMRQSGLSGLVSLPIPDMIPWTPDNPYLYGLTVTLYRQSGPDAAGGPGGAEESVAAGESGGVEESVAAGGFGAEEDLDQVESYFAMRHVGIEKDEAGIYRLSLNHQPIFQNGVLDQGYWPDGLMTAPCDEALVYDIQAMKDCGFNVLRKHCKIEPLRWYYHCDRLGMLVWQDMVNGGSTYHMISLCYLPTLFPLYGRGHHDVKLLTGRMSRSSRQEWYEQCRETITLLKNHPSIVTWVLFNEGWGQFDARKTLEFARELDDSRLIDAASGWFDHGIGDFRSVHRYFRKVKCPTDRRNAKKGIHRALVISEYGGRTYAVPGHTATKKVYGYSGAKCNDEWKGKVGALLWDIDQLNKQGLSGAIYTQLSDIEDEVNGILTYDRQINKIRYSEWE